MLELKYGKRRVVSYRGARKVIGGLTAKNKIEILLHITREFSNAEEQSELFGRVIHLCIDIFEADDIGINLWDEDHLVSVANNKNIKMESDEIPIHKYADYVYNTGKEICLDDLNKHPQFQESERPTCSVLCVPIMIKEETFGTISIEKDASYFYTQSDLEIFQALADQLSIALNRANLMHNLISAQKQNAFDLKIGRSIQQQILPNNMLSWNGIDCSAFYEPINEVSGDYYSLVRRKDHLTILIADVSGHGIPAALVTMAIDQQFHPLAAAGLGLPEILVELNNSLLPILPSGIYFTAQILRIFSDQHFALSNAGHQKLLFYHRSKNILEKKNSEGLPLGLRRVTREQYDEVYGKIEAGDVILMNTDGIIEQKNGEGIETGEERVARFLTQIIPEITNAKADIILSGIIGKWQQFLGETSIKDDATAVLLSVSEHLPDAIHNYFEGRGHHASGRPDMALEFAEKCHEIEPSYAPNLYFMCRLYISKRMFDEARQSIQAYINHTGSMGSKDFHVLGRLCQKLNDISSAKRAYKKALALKPNFKEVLLSLASCYILEKQYDKALRYLEKGSRMHPEESKFATTIEKLKKFKGANQ